MGLAATGYAMSLLLAACSCACADEAAPATGKVEITTTAPMSSAAIPISAAAGSRFTITLESNVTTGYKWKLANQLTGKTVKLVGSTYNSPKNGRIGQGGTESWTFEALGKGKASIVLQYARPWEKNVKPAKEQSFEVVVSGQ